MVKKLSYKQKSKKHSTSRTKKYSRKQKGGAVTLIRGLNKQTYSVPLNTSDMTREELIMNISQYAENIKNLSEQLANINSTKHSNSIYSSLNTSTRTKSLSTSPGLTQPTPPS